MGTLNFYNRGGRSFQVIEGGKAIHDLSADEFATGKQLVATWTSALKRCTDPTYAHLSEIAAVADDVLEADSYDSMRAALLQVSNGARHEMAERCRRERR